MRQTLGVLVLAGAAACAPKPTVMTDAQRAAIADTARAIVTSTFMAASKKDVLTAFASYSSDPDTRYTENGVTYPNLDALRKANTDLVGPLEALTVAPGTMDVMVLSPDAAVVTSKMSITLKPAGKPEFKTTGVLTSVVQRRNGKWRTVYSHESDLNIEQMEKAITAPPAKAKPKTAPAKKATAKPAPKKK
jgi:hypothetical protein